MLGSSDSDSDSDSPSLRASKTKPLRMRPKKRRRGAAATRLLRTDDVHRFVAGMEEAVDIFNRISTPSETARRVRRLKERTKEVKELVRGLKERAEGKGGLER